MEFFAHPWYMAAGGALISAPILIHLINRMRFKRIRWAAMEFLLKSQKRNRRRMIIEQLILLLLRILLVLLAAFLVARFLYGGTGPRGATHIVIFDDGLSMADAGKQGEETSTAYGVGIAQVKKIARNAAKAASAQYMRIYLLSEIDKQPVFDSRLGESSERDIEAAFAQRGNKPTMLALSPLAGLERGRKIFSDSKADQGQRFVHLVSDFRDRDWASGPEAEKLADPKDGVVRSILESGVHVNLVDVAAPFRLSNSKVVTHHDNLAIVDLKAESRVAVEDLDIEFTATVMNYGAAEGRTFLKVSINGEDSPGSDSVLEKIPSNSKVEHKFTLRFNSKRKGTEIGPKDGPEERERKRRLEREYNVVRVTIQREDAGLNADNVRDLVIEVRKKVPTLVIDGNRPEGRGDASDMSILQTFYTASLIYEVEERKLSELATSDLDLYPSVILLNVGELPEPAVKKLQAYVQNGGSVAWFLGEEVKADHYNNTLFPAGLFPLLLEGSRGYDPLVAQGVNDPDKRRELQAEARSKDRTPKILFPDPNDVLVRRLSLAGSLFRYLGLNVYWKAQPRSAWDPSGRLTKSLIALPNRQEMKTFQPRAMDLMSAADAAVNKLASREEEYKKYLPLMDEYRNRTVRDALVRGELFAVAEALDSLLNSQAQIDPATKAETRPSMATLWQHPDLKGLADEIRAFRDTILFGDPLIVSKTVGKGRVMAMLTPLGTNRRGAGEDAVEWNDWATADPVARIHPLFMLDLHRYLISEGQAPNRVLGEETRFSVDAARYLPDVRYTFTPQPDVGLGGPPEAETEKGVMEKDGGALAFALKGVKRPGVFRVTLTQQGDGPLEDREEVRAYAYNVDAVSESDLKRAGRDRLDPDLPQSDGKRGKLTLRTPNDNYEAFQEKQPDASESPWLYLFFILILVVEQAMAVHLSYHLKGNEAAPAAPSSAPVAA